MKAEIKTRWLEALRSGRYQQTQGKLRTDVGHCCLGVLCDVVEPDSWRDDEDGWRHGINRAYLPEHLCITTGLQGAETTPLMKMNDDGLGFASIADWIDENISADAT
jgi:hypothetical protein